MDINNFIISLSSNFKRFGDLLMSILQLQFIGLSLNLFLRYFGISLAEFYFLYYNHGSLFFYIFCILFFDQHTYSFYPCFRRTWIKVELFNESILIEQYLIIVEDWNSE